MEQDYFNGLTKDAILVVLSKMDDDTLNNTCISNSRIQQICNKNAIQIFKPRFDKEYPGFDINSVKPENLGIVYKAFADGLVINNKMPDISWNFISFSNINIVQNRGEQNMWNGELININDVDLEKIPTLYVPFSKNRAHEIYILWNQDDDIVLPDMLFKIRRDRPVTLIDIFKDIAESNSDEITNQTKEYNQNILDKYDENILETIELPEYANLKSGNYTLTDFETIQYSSYKFIPNDGILKYWLLSDFNPN